VPVDVSGPVERNVNSEKKGDGEQNKIKEGRDNHNSIDFFLGFSMG
jgi:hypothetical protein